MAETSEMTKTKTHGAWIWYELITPNPEGAKAFYEPLLGWNMQMGGEATNGYGFIANADGGMAGGILTRTDELKERGCTAKWIGYIGADNVDETIAEIEKAGGKVLMPAQDVPMAGRIAMVADCCGAEFYVMTPLSQNEGEVSTSFSAAKRFGRCGWNELHAGNAANAEQFYTSLFGWGTPDFMDMGELGKYQFVAHNGETCGAIMGMMPDIPFPIWSHYFWVESIEACKEIAEKNGGTIINGPMEVPGGDWIIQGVDPQGVVFSLVGAK